jgi:hypothetical protein
MPSSIWYYPYAISYKLITIFFLSGSVCKLLFYAAQVADEAEFCEILSFIENLRSFPCVISAFPSFVRVT